MEAAETMTDTDKAGHRMLLDVNLSNIEYKLIMAKGYKHKHLRVYSEDAIKSIKSINRICLKMLDNA